MTKPRMDEHTEAPDSAPSAIPDDFIKTLEAERDKFKDLAYRAAAELDNYRKRVTRERDDLRFQSKKEIISYILPALDAFDAACRAADQEVPEDLRKKYIEGFEAIGRRLKIALESAGLADVDTPAESPFDAQLHDAVDREERSDVESPFVLEILQRGYMLDGKLIRPARVKVAVPQKKE